MGIPDHLTCLLRNLCAGQEATVKTGYWTTDWFQVGKGVYQGCILSLCLFNLSAEYVMQNARLDEAQAGIKIAGRNLNNLRYADNTTLMSEWTGTKEPLHESERGEWKHWLKTQHSKTEITASGTITSWKIDEESMKTVKDLIWGAPKSLQMVTAAMKLKGTCSLEEKLWPTYRGY